MTVNIALKTCHTIFDHIECSSLDDRVFASDAGGASFVRRKKACNSDTYSGILCPLSFLGDTVIRRNAMKGTGFLKSTVCGVNGKSGQS